jgi:adenylate cyclase
MGVEIERKFLVRNEGWRSVASDGRMIRQGYLARGDGVTVRVRVLETRALLTVKGRRAGISRPEFEYEIPLEDAEGMLGDLCHQPPIEKLRWRLPYGGLVWEIDEYQGRHRGLVIAEVELERADQAAPLPTWIGPEITHDPRYGSAALLAAVPPTALWG